MGVDTPSDTPLFRWDAFRDGLEAAEGWAPCVGGCEEAERLGRVVPRRLLLRVSLPAPWAEGEEPVGVGSQSGVYVLQPFLRHSAPVWRREEVLSDGCLPGVPGGGDEAAEIREREDGSCRYITATRSGYWVITWTLDGDSGPGSRVPAYHRSYAAHQGQPPNYAEWCSDPSDKSKLNPHVVLVVLDPLWPQDLRLSTGGTLKRDEGAASWSGCGFLLTETPGSPTRRRWLLTRDSDGTRGESHPHRGRHPHEVAFTHCGWDDVQVCPEAPRPAVALLTSGALPCSEGGFEAGGWASCVGWVLPEGVQQPEHDPVAVAEGAPRERLVLLRCANQPNKDHVAGAHGGWGPTGASNSPLYVARLLREVTQDERTVEAVSVFVTSSAQLALLPTPSLARRRLLSFVWPSAHTGWEHTGYLDRLLLWPALQRFEADGCTCVYPHRLELYRMLTSKGWLHETTQWASPDLAATLIPTVALRGDVEGCGWAEQAAVALAQLPAGVRRGVVKLGYSWEAKAVRLWSVEGCDADAAPVLSHVLSSIVADAGSVDFIFVQPFITHVCEPRVFVIEGEPRRIVYTLFGTGEGRGGGGLTDSDSDSSDEDSVESAGRHDEIGCFAARDRESALERWFEGDEEKLSAAERLVTDAARGWVAALSARHGRTPAVVRCDFFVALEEGGVKVFLNELTECGAATLGWAEGGEVTLRAAARAVWDE
eukprot:Hpha_TRINITY_DN30852_c0_g1::TRINITY_DN30852_c0_g1_i1::g.155642::m.155642